MTIAHIYLAFFIIGIIGLLSSLIFGDFGHGDFDHDLGSQDLHSGDTDSPKILSLRVIFSFLLAFSIGGAALYFADKSLGLQLLVGFVAGITTAALVYYLMKFLYSFQGVSNIDSINFLLKDAVVTVGTTHTGLCQVEVDSTGGDRLFMAKEANDLPLAKNDVVKITDRKGSTLIVIKK